MFHPRIACHGGLVCSWRKPLPESESILPLCHPHASAVLSKQGLWGRTAMRITQEAGWKICPRVTAVNTLHRKGWVALGPDCCTGARQGLQTRNKNVSQRLLPPLLGGLLYRFYPPPWLTSPDLCSHYQTPGNIKLHKGSHLIHFYTLSRQEQCLRLGR